MISFVNKNKAWDAEHIAGVVEHSFAIRGLDKFYNTVQGQAILVLNNGVEWYQWRLPKSGPEMGHRRV